MRAHLLATRPEPVGELGHALLQLLDAIGEQANHLVEIADRLILEGDSALELRDSVFHCRSVRPCLSRAVTGASVGGTRPIATVQESLLVRQSFQASRKLWAIRRCALDSRRASSSRTRCRMAIAA